MEGCRSAIGDAGDLPRSLQEVLYEDKNEYLSRKQFAGNALEAAKIDLEYAESAIHPFLVNRYVNRARASFIHLDVDNIEALSLRIRSLLQYGVYVFHENEMPLLNYVEGDADVLKQDTMNLMERVQDFFDSILDTGTYCIEE